MNKRAASQARHVARLMCLGFVLLASSIVAWQPGVRAGDGTGPLLEAFFWRRPKVKIVGWVYPASETQWRVGDQVVGIEPDSPLADDAVGGGYAAVTAIVTDDGQLQADGIFSRPATSIYGSTVEFRCLIQEITPRYWIVCNRVVLVTEKTTIQGRPEVDSLAEVKGIRLTGDTMLAQSIRVALPAAYSEVEFEGPIEGIGDDAWLVNGIPVAISAVTTIRGVPELGVTAEVRGFLQPDGSVLADVITVKGAGSTPQLDVEGLVETIDPAYWVVGGTTIWMDARTFVDDSRAPAEVGMWASVRALVRQDGTLLALRIRLSRPN
jgi:hypothetical protein